MSENNLWSAEDNQTGTEVFLLGAGCSRDCGSPLMREFLDRVVRNRRDERAIHLFSAYEATLKYIEEFEKIFKYMSPDWRNLEDIFTQAHLRELSGFNDGLCDNMRLVIWDTYRRPAVRIEDTAFYSFAAYLLGIVRNWTDGRGPRPVVITTNYDIHLETALAQISYVENRNRARHGHATEGTPAWYPGAFDDVLSSRDRECAILSNELGISQRKNMVEVLKLHGSINWRLRSTHAVLDGNWIGIARSEDIGAPDFVVSFSVERDDFTDPGNNKPLIVPPLLGKIANHDVVVAHWKRAISAFKNATTIWVIGYSFPETDIFMARLMAQGLKENKYQLGKIRIINPVINGEDGKEFKERVTRLFSKNVVQNSLEFESIDFRKFVDIYGESEPEVGVALI